MAEIRLTSRLHREIRSAMRVVVADKMRREIPRLEAALARAVWHVLKREHDEELRHERAQLEQRGHDQAARPAQSLAERLTDLSERARNVSNQMSQRGVWRMSIPARHDDSDLTIHDLAEAADEATLEITAPCDCKPEYRVDRDNLRAAIKMRAVLESAFASDARFTKVDEGKARGSATKESA